jgi:hypothetical protein
MNNASAVPVKETPPGSTHSRVTMPGLLRKAPAIAKRRIEYLLIPLALLLFLGLWNLIMRLGDYPPFILPSPLQVYKKLLNVVISRSPWWRYSGDWPWG